METIPAFARHDLTDAQWAVLEPLLPVGKKPGRPPVHTKRQLFSLEPDTSPSGEWHLSSTRDDAEAHYQPFPWR